MASAARIFFLYLILITSSLSASHGAAGQFGWNNSTKNLVDADILIDKISNNGNIIYGPESVINGDLNLDKVKSKSIMSDINISSEINGKIIATNKIFNGKVCIWRSIVHDDVSFAGSVFLNDAFFAETNFRNKLSFDDAKFKGRARFQGAIFTMNAGFRNAAFLGSNNFLKTTFNGRADFSMSRFYERGEFQFSDFKERAIFHNADFREGLTFLGSDFLKDVEFSGAKFGGDALFESIKCYSAMNFNAHPFIGLKGSDFSRLISFENSAIQYLNLNNCSFSNESDLILNDCDYYRLNARWNDIKDHIPFDKDVFISLVNYYKRVGQFEDSDACYREYNLKSDYSPGTWIVSRFLWITSDFGTDAWRTVRLLVFLSLLFTLLYFKGKSIREKSRPFNYLPFWDCLYFSIMVLVNFSSDYKALGRWRWVVLAERVIGWILLAILIITIVRLGLR